MWETFLGKRLLGVKFAFRGAWMLLRTEASIQVQAVIALLLTVAGFYMGLTTWEWIAQTFAIGLVMGIEGLNTAVEKLSDFVEPDRHPQIGRVKDMGAGAVFIAAVAAVVIGSLIYLPKF